MFEAEDKIAAIQAWSDCDENSWFDMTFVDSLADYLEEHGELTDKQEAALDTIMERNNIAVGDWVND